MKENLLAAIERDRDEIIEFLCGFIRVKSPNPPGNTQAAARYVGAFLEAEGLGYRVVAPNVEFPNVVASFATAQPRRHLVLNGHIDVFPVDPVGWTKDPWGGEVVDGKIFGRGACDMKAGTAASILTYRYLHRIRDRLNGRLTLTCVSDEETLGPWGARYLVDNCPDVLGDCMLSGEPSGRNAIRFGEKGLLWVTFEVRRPGAHGSYTHKSESAIKVASRVVADIEALTEIPASPPREVEEAMGKAEPFVEQIWGKGAANIIPKVTVNVGVIAGGLKNNMIPSHCKFEVDIRVPPGVDKATIIRELERIAGRYPQVTFEENHFTAPAYCDPYGEMSELLRRNANQLANVEPAPIVSLAGTDARLWRYRDVPAYIYGPPPIGIASHDENVSIDDYLHVVRTHVLSAYDYLS
ncbi:peptidase M20 family succinyl-diaminopimelate desuccinylase-like protein (plasmid) [Rhizobium etli bv. mimosae str. IE4771]|uniref:Peptidase M20 family succinyl-diaminopimelate desuccinylase-like protein n=1 Tax=Rhizobium etli bv. mimosae str. IE4771 TaxID=1432050 RepID=A0A060ID47_RHIET|nr:M20/M25/M40 family metallo-hydrolase [Rhizobium sp. IE4771]AIC29985.1 peptidase M20 family succinyl-diaminopimelate desuccinylase-like protein [Rhizobium sp. IE4771]